MYLSDFVFDVRGNNINRSACRRRNPSQAGDTYARVRFCGRNYYRSSEGRGTRPQNASVRQANVSLWPFISQLHLICTACLCSISPNWQLIPENLYQNGHVQQWRSTESPRGVSEELPPEDAEPTALIEFWHTHLRTHTQQHRHLSNPSRTHRLPTKLPSYCFSLREST